MPVDPRFLYQLARIIDSPLNTRADPESLKDYMMRFWTWSTDEARRTHQALNTIASSPVAGAIANASYITIDAEAGLTEERRLVVTAPVVRTDAGPNSTVTLSLSISGLTPQPLGTATAGVTGQVSDAGHVHPLGDIVSGPSISVIDNVATYSNTVGDIKDSGISIGTLVKGPATSTHRSIPRFDAANLGDIEDPVAFSIDASAHLVPVGVGTQDAGSSGQPFRDGHFARFVNGLRGGFFGAGALGFTTATDGDGLVVAMTQSDYTTFVPFQVVAEYDANSVGVGHTVSNFVASVASTWEPDGTATGKSSEITVMFFEASGGRTTPVWDGTVNSVNLFSGSIALSAPEAITALNGLRFDSLQTTGTAATQTASVNLGTGNGTRHYGLISNGDIRLRGLRELWFGPLIETGTPLTSIHAKTTAGQILTFKINAADTIFQFENTGVNSGAQLWMRDESNATARYVKTKFLSSSSLSADRVLTIDMFNADQTLRPAWLAQDLRTTGTPGFATIGVSDTDVTHFMRIACGSNLTADRVLTFTPGDAARTITLSGNPTLNDWFDQNVKVAGTPTFAGLTLSGNQTFNDAINIVVNTSTGTKIATGTTQKLGFWNAAPVAQHSSTGETAGYTANAGSDNVFNTSTFTGNVGSTAYTISDVVKCLKNAGFMAS